MVFFLPIPQIDPWFWEPPIFLGKDWAPRKGWGWNPRYRIDSNTFFTVTSRSSLLRTEEHGNKPKRLGEVLGWLMFWVMRLLLQCSLAENQSTWIDNQKNPFILEVIWYLADTPTWSAVHNYTHPVLLTNSNTPLPFLISCFHSSCTNHFGSIGGNLTQEGSFSSLIKSWRMQQRRMPPSPLISWSWNWRSWGHLFDAQRICFFALTTCWKKDGDKDQVHPNLYSTQQDSQWKTCPVCYLFQPTKHSLCSGKLIQLAGKWSFKRISNCFSINLRIILSNQLSWWRYNSSKHRLSSEPAGKSSRIPVRIILLLLGITILLQVHSICAHLPQTNHILVV